MIIPDCDETYNYWDPLNLLVRGFGKQTWEYSPEFAIRSYSYLLPYYIISYPVNYIVKEWGLPSYYIFYFIRFVLNGFTVYSELKLYYSLKKTFPNSSNWYLFLTAIATGMSHAGVALLPSSFAMQCVTMSISYALKEFSIGNAVGSLTWIMIGGLFGWPFVLALAVPYGLYTLLHYKQLSSVIIRCIVNLSSIVAVIVTIDSFFYKKLAFIPLNIVLYNVFGGEGEGPEIFGVEPFSYYILNLALNFNVVAIFGFIGLVDFSGKKWAINLPLILWCLIFGSQPHKEERFLYPIYSLIIANAAVALGGLYTFVDGLLENINARIISKISKVLVVFLISSISFLRTVNLVENYSTPLVVSKELAHLEGGNVCIGREWYHFPTSFFLNNDQRLKYIKSGFDGLLPGDFKEGEPLFDVTSFTPEGFNNKNMFSETTIIPFEQCDYYIDNSGKTNGIEPDFTNEPKDWERVTCKKIINPDGNHGIGRLIYIPPILRTFIPYNVDYMEFCLYKKHI